MSLLSLIAMASFAFVTSVTPGPNNLMLLASGANFGFRRTLPHIVGISLGMALLLTCVLGGLGELFSRYPLLQLLLRIAGAGYLLWLSWKILRPPHAACSRRMPTGGHSPGGRRCCSSSSTPRRGSWPSPLSAVSP